jgi:hypothetical protein
MELAQSKGIDLSPADLIFPEISPAPELPESPPHLPIAEWFGSLELGDGMEIPCYVLNDHRRIISRTGATGVLTGNKGGGNLESYIGVEVIKPFMPPNLQNLMVEFSIKEVVNKNVFGFEADTFLDICRGYTKARDAEALKTPRQMEIAIQAGMFLSACAKVGLIALIDEATGYQYDRAQDALRFKLKLYLEEEMRKWERTFPEELWKEFSRLTKHKGSIVQRPKYWGKLVMELIYDYLDKDVADWLRKNAPKPQHGQNYHQWLSSQYGLRKLTEHIWMVIGMASASHSMRELRDKMAERYGRKPVQLTFYLPPE